MRLLTMWIMLGLAASTQAATNIVEVPVDAETEALMLKLLIQDMRNYKDFKFKINPNKKRLSSEDKIVAQPYLSELFETESSEGASVLNKKLSKHLDRLQERLNYNTEAPKCKCKNVSKIRPGVIKCECAGSRNDDDGWQGEGREYRQDREDTQDEYTLDDESENRRIRSDEDREFENRDDSYWTDDTSCGCELLRSTSKSKDKTLNLRCRCNSPLRTSDNIDNGYWSDDNYCGCKLLRNKGDSKGTKNLRCRCNTPLRRGGNKDDGYWSDDNYCGCKLLRNKGDSKDIKNLRCRCNSALRTGGNIDDGYWSDDNYCGCKLLRNKDESKGIQNLRCRCNSPAVSYRSSSGFSIFDYDKSAMKNRQYGAQLSDLSDDDRRSEESTRTVFNEHDSLNTLLNYVLKRDNNVDISKLPKMKRKILIKLREIVPNLRNVDEAELKNKIVSMVTADENALRQSLAKAGQKSNAAEISQLPLEARKRLLKIMEQQTRGTNYRKSMRGDVMGVPFTLDVQALAQINN